MQVLIALAYIAQGVWLCEYFDKNMVGLDTP